MTEKIHRTALDLPPEEWKKYQPLQAILQRKSATHSQLERRRKRAMRVARQAASLLRKEFDAKKVVLFGSLAIQESFTLWSDIEPNNTTFLASNSLRKNAAAGRATRRA